MVCNVLKAQARVCSVWWSDDASLLAIAVMAGPQIADAMQSHVVLAAVLFQLRNQMLLGNCCRKEVDGIMVSEP